MAIEKLPEFSKNGQKNTDKLVLEDGFPVNLKPARQWFNFLFNQLTLSINQIIDENYIQHSEIIDNLISSNIDKPLSAKQGKALQDEKLDRKLNPAINDANIPGTSPGEISFDLIWGGQTKNAPDRTGVYGAYMQTIQWPTSIFNAQMVQGMGDNPFIAYRGNNGGIYTTWRYVAFEDGNIASATKLQTARTVGFSGAATGSFNYDGSANSSCVLTLANSGVAASTYGSALKIPVLTVNAKGLITVVSEKEIQVVNDLTTGGADKILSAEQGKILDSKKVNLGEFGLGAAFPFSQIKRGGFIGKNGFFSWSSGADDYPDAQSQPYMHGIEITWSPSESMQIARSLADPDRLTYRSFESKRWLQLLTNEDNAPSATKLQTARKITLSGAVSGNATFDGTSDVTINVVSSDIDVLAYTPIPWMKVVPPSGFLVFMGQSISQAVYPILFSLYGPRLPDMRAQSIRGLDGGRGIDVGRVILSEQGDAIRNITGQFKAALEGYSGNSNPQTGGAFSATEKASSGFGGSGGDDWARIYRLDASSIVPTASENRVKNIAFNYIVKAG